MLYELLTWRLPWNFADVSPYKVWRLAARAVREDGWLGKWEARRRHVTCGTCGTCTVVHHVRHETLVPTCCNYPRLPGQVIATIRQGGRPGVPPPEALPGSDTTGWAGLDDYVQLMR